MIFIGLDSGGAKTAGVLCDQDGRVLARARDIGAAIVGLPDERFYSVVEPLIARLCAEAGVALAKVSHVAIGLSGVDFPDEQGEQHRLIARRLTLEGRLTLVNDGVVALWGVSPAARSALVQHGSGITTAWREAYGAEAIYDSLDVAEVFDLRRAAIALTARMIDGRAAATGLRDRVLAHCGVEAKDFAAWFFREPEAKTLRASVAPVVFGAWREGDVAASEIVERAVADYILTAQAMTAEMEDGFEIAFAGGVIDQGGPALQHLLRSRLATACPGAIQVPVALPPEDGAAVLAGFQMGLPPGLMFANLARAPETAQ
jgi:N-acetylglucosamine kinase-like BadF-type ATPase